MVGSYLMSLDDKGITLRYLKVVKIRGKGYGGGGGATAPIRKGTYIPITERDKKYP